MPVVGLACMLARTHARTHAQTHTHTHAHTPEASVYPQQRVGF
jgi:hypothetical protein